MGLALAEVRSALIVILRVLRVDARKVKHGAWRSWSGQGGSWMIGESVRNLYLLRKQSPVPPLLCFTTVWV